MTAKDLAERLSNVGFEVSKRTIERDLQDLSLIFPYMDASRLPRTSAVWYWTGIGCSFISGLWCRLDSLLALMGSADPQAALLADEQLDALYQRPGADAPVRQRLHPLALVQRGPSPISLPRPSATTSFG
ncbi:MAG: hypothetical protein ACREX4_23175 [Gammaproteobacteria bacterium]